MCNIGSLDQWMELATECGDKALKLFQWIDDPRIVNTRSVSLVLSYIADDLAILKWLQRTVGGINAARTDIISGGQNWWRENKKGVSNIFSAISIAPRECRDMQDLFRGLLGIFSGLFTPQEIETELAGDDIEKMSFAFFKKLSNETGHAWTKLSVSSGDRGEWDWIPMMERRHDSSAEQETEGGEEIAYPAEKESEDEDDEDGQFESEEEEEQESQEQRVEEARGLEPEKQKRRNNQIKTDIFAGVATLGVLRKEGRAKTLGHTGVIGVPRPFMSIHLKEENPEFHFIFTGCNCGKKLSTGLFKKETLRAQERPINVAGDETGKTLAHIATVLGSALDPAGNVLEYKSRLLHRLNPQWKTSDPNARPSNWPERCVSGTAWENKECTSMGRMPHNTTMNYHLGAITGCDSRLSRGTTAKISCEVRINCGCVITAPFSLIFEALMAVQGSSLGQTDEVEDDDGRIVMKDGLGLVQIGDLGRTFNVVAFGGDLDFHKRRATLYRKKSFKVPILETRVAPIGRALIRSDFTHSVKHMMRDYAYVPTEVGNLLICRDHPLGNYRIRGVCIDDEIASKQQGQWQRVRIQ